jgi:hypothetical protein
MLSRLTVLSSMALFLGTPIVAQVPDAFSLTISPAIQTVKLGNPVNITVTLKNVSPKNIQVYKDISGDASLMYEFDVLDKSEIRQCMTEIYGASKDHKGDCPNPKPSSQVAVTVTSGFDVVLKPGAELQDSTDLAKQFLFDVVGTYTVRVLRFDEVNKQIKKSNVVTIVRVDK